MAIFFHKKIAFKTLNLHRSADSRILLMIMEHDNNIITVVYVYAPNSDIYELTSLKIVMYKMKMIKKKSGKIVREMIQSFDLYDM